MGKFGKNFNKKPDESPPKLLPFDYVLKYSVIPLTPGWVKPNHITLLRFFLIPLVIWLMLAERYYAGTWIFLFAAFTDAWDGALARIKDKITVWGQIYDPLADKLLVGSIFMILGLRYFWVLTVILMLIDLSFIFAGWYWKRKGYKIKANWWGKIKMILQVIGLIILMISIQTGIGWLLVIAGIILFLAIFFAIASLITHGI